MHGRGGHSGDPHTVDDAVLALAPIVVATQQVSAGRIDPVMQDIVDHVAAAHGCRGELRFASSEPPLLNDATLATTAVSLLQDLGHPATADFRSFGSDDFSHYTSHALCLMMFVGTGLIGGGLHDARYLPGDEYVELVAAALIELRPR